MSAMEIDSDSENTSGESKRSQEAPGSREDAILEASRNKLQSAEAKAESDPDASKALFEEVLDNAGE